MTVGAFISGVSVAERHPSVLALRLLWSLRVDSFSSTRGANFSDLSDLEVCHERAFSRDSLEKHLVEKISNAILERESSLIVGGPGGIGKSVFWEALLRRRPVLRGDGVWANLPGPTRVVNLLKCKDLDAFESHVISAFYPTPFLPSFGLSSPPTYAGALHVLECALQRLPKKSPLVLFIEDVNHITTFKDWETSYATLANAIASNGNAVIVGNSSALLAYMNFEGLSHSGRRTSVYFFPSLRSDDKELLQFAQNGGHLWAMDSGGHTGAQSLVSKINVWGGNVKLVKKGTSNDEDLLRTKIGQSLREVRVPVHWAGRVLLPESSRERILKLRKELLQQLADSPASENHELRVKSLSPEMKELMIAEQLAALDLVVFRTVRNESGEEIVVAPCYPAVLLQYQAYIAATKPPAAAPSWWKWW